MICPKCNVRARCRMTLPMKGQHLRYRVYECRPCGWALETVESDTYPSRKQFEWVKGQGRRSSKFIKRFKAKQHSEPFEVYSYPVDGPRVKL